MKNAFEASQHRSLLHLSSISVVPPPHVFSRKMNNASNGLHTMLQHPLFSQGISSQRRILSHFSQSSLHEAITTDDKRLAYGGEKTKLVVVRALTVVIISVFLVQLLVRKFQQHDIEGPKTNLRRSVVSLSRESLKCVWDTADYPLISFVLFLLSSLCAICFAPTVVTAEYVESTRKGAFIVCVAWFLLRLKKKVFALATLSNQGRIRGYIDTVEKVSSIGIWLLAALILREHCYLVFSIGAIGGAVSGVLGISEVQKMFEGICYQYFSDGGYSGDRRWSEAIKVVVDNY